MFNVEKLKTLEQQQYMLNWVANYELVEALYHDYYEVFQVVPDASLTFSYENDSVIKFSKFFFNYKYVTKKELKNLIMYLGYSFEMFGNEEFLLKFGFFIAHLRVEYYLFCLLKVVKLDELYYLFNNITYNEVLYCSRVINVTFSFYYSQRNRFSIDKFNELDFVRAVFNYLTAYGLKKNNIRSIIKIKRDWYEYQNGLLKKVNESVAFVFLNFFKYVNRVFIGKLFLLLNFWFKNKKLLAVKNKKGNRFIVVLFRKFFFFFLDRFYLFFSGRDIDLFSWKFGMFFIRYLRAKMYRFLYLIVFSSRKLVVKYFIAMVYEIKICFLNFFKFYVRMFEYRRFFYSLNNMQFNMSIVLKRYYYNKFSFLLNNGLSTLDNFPIWSSVTAMPLVFFNDKRSINLNFRKIHLFLINCLRNGFFSMEFKTYLFLLFRMEFFQFSEKNKFVFISKFYLTERSHVVFFSG